MGSIQEWWVGAAMIRVRRALPEDWDDIVAMDRTLFLPADEAPVETDEWWLVHVDGVLAGYAAAKMSHRWDDTIYLSRAGVDWRFRGLRLQMRLLRAREAWGRSIGARWAITDVASHNVPSMRSLIRGGYLPYLPSRPWRDAAATYWRKALVRDR